jgi:hypothetical protein
VFVISDGRRCTEAHVGLADAPVQVVRLVDVARVRREARDRRSGSATIPVWTDRRASPGAGDGG